MRCNSTAGYQSYRSVAAKAPTVSEPSHDAVCEHEPAAGTIECDDTDGETGLYLAECNRCECCIRTTEYVTDPVNADYESL